jgi:hypothetical protein
MNILNELKELLPIYTTKLPYSNIEVQYQPFKVKDIKNISIVLQEDNKKLAFMSMIEVLKHNTRMEYNDLLNLCLADAEYLFLQIRSKSVEETLNLIYKNEKIKVNILDIKSKNSIQAKTIKLSDSIKIEIETPKVKKLLKLDSFNKDDFIKGCVKRVIIKNEIYDVDKFLTDEVQQLIDNLPIKILNDFDTFIKTEPELYIEIKTESDQTSKEVSGILNFFTFR